MVEKLFNAKFNFSRKLKTYRMVPPTIHRLIDQNILSDWLELNHRRWRFDDWSLDDGWTWHGIEIFIPNQKCIIVESDGEVADAVKGSKCRQFQREELVGNVFGEGADVGN